VLEVWPGAPFAGVPPTFLESADGLRARMQRAGDRISLELTSGAARRFEIRWLHRPSGALPELPPGWSEVAAENARAAGPVAPGHTIRLEW
jgi:hypothetical protein